MKSYILTLLTVLATLFSSANVFAAKDKDGGGQNVPKMACQSLTNHLRAKLQSMGCRLGGYSGHNGSDEAHKKTGSCHNRGRAIDIESIVCTGDRANKSKEENLRDLAWKLGAMFGRFGSLTYTICYKDIGKSFCRPGHDQHLHFGAKESRNCSCPEDKWF